MKNMLVAALLLASAAPAVAQTYAEVGVGANFGQSVSTKTYTVTSGANTAVGKVDLDYDTGIAAGAEIGYAGLGDIPELRLGLGYDYIEGKFKSGLVTGTVNGAPGTFSFNRATVTSLGATLDDNVHLVTANAYYDLPSFGAITPFLGAGLGGAFIDHADSSFALTASAGFRMPISDNAYLGVRYRFYHVDSTTDNIGIKYEPIMAHSVMAILGLNLD